MDYETISEVEKYIESLDNPNKQIIAKELMLNSNFELFVLPLYGNNEIFLKDLSNGNIFKFDLYISSKCNC
jgi:hypothetical protein